MAVTIDDVRAVAGGLERAYEVMVAGRVKWRVGRLVFLAFSTDETLMGFGFPRELRQGLVEAEPDKFMYPKPGDMRYQWAVVRLAAIDREEMTELVQDAWAMVVPKGVAARHFAKVIPPDEPPRR